MERGEQVSEFRGTARWFDGWWALEVEGPGLRRPAHTQVRRLDQIEETVGDLLTLRFDAEVECRLAFTRVDWSVSGRSPWRGGVRRLSFITMGSHSDTEGEWHGWVAES
ncbi:hypothetical protein ABT352_30405 [Streptosporangium sp. NPDC000563]|uniref:hypothetical protein n=1 Tax=Streptosporangium sp. NPDC000563 TaxID=3154366 RepID=UPI003317F09D